MLVLAGSIPIWDQWSLTEATPQAKQQKKKALVKMKLKRNSVKTFKKRALFSDQYSKLHDEITSPEQTWWIFPQKRIYNQSKCFHFHSVTLCCVVYYPFNVQLLDVQHEPIKTFVSGLSQTFQPSWFDRETHALGCQLTVLRFCLLISRWIKKP